MWRGYRVVAEVGRRGVGRGGRTFPCYEESSGAGVGVVRGRCGAGVWMGAALGATRQDAARVWRRYDAAGCDGGSAEGSDLLRSL